MTQHQSDLQPRAVALLSTAHAFCSAFAAGTPPTELLNRYFRPTASIHEHGPAPSDPANNNALPFLGKTFTGRRQPETQSDHHTTHQAAANCDDYYDFLTSTLAFHPLPTTVPSLDDFHVDPTTRGNSNGVVTVKLRGRFESVRTGKQWEEEFCYVLSEFDDAGERIGRQEIWADPLSAWMAVQE